MAFDINGLSEIRALARNRYAHAYDTSDDLSTVLASGYFDGGWYRLGVGDRLDIEAGDGRILATVTASSSSGVTISASTDVIPAGRLAAGSVARSVEDVLAESVSVKNFGAIAGGSAAVNTAAFQAAANAGIPISIPRGAWTLNNEISINYPNTAFVGQHNRQSRLVSSYPFIFRVRDGADNFAAMAIGLESTYVAASDIYYGLIYVNRESVDGIYISRCYFDVPSANTNAMHLIADKADGSNIIQNIWFVDNVMNRIGNSGIVLQNHLHSDAAYRIRNVWVERNHIIAPGSISPDYGMFLSCSGRITNVWARDNVMTDILGIGMEMSNGCSNVHFHRNCFRAITRTSGALGYTHAVQLSQNQSPVIPNLDCSFVGNWTERDTVTPTGAVFADCERLEISGNYLRCAASVKIQDCNDAFGDGNHFVIDNDNYPLIFKGTAGKSCKRNRLTNTIIDATAKASVTTMVYFDGTSGSCDANALRGGRLLRPAGGSWATQSDAANSRNKIEEMGTGSEDFQWVNRTISIAGQTSYSVNLLDAQYEYLTFTGALSADCAISLYKNTKYLIYNNTTGGYNLTIGPYGQPTTTKILPGSRRAIYVRTADSNDVTPGLFTRGQITWSGGGSSLTTTVTGVAATDYVFASIHTKPSQAATINRAVCNTNQVIIDLSAANTSNDAVIDYIVIRP